MLSGVASFLYCKVSGISSFGCHVVDVQNNEAWWWVCLLGASCSYSWFGSWNWRSHSIL